MTRRVRTPRAFAPIVFAVGLPVACELRAPGPPEFQASDGAGGNATVAPGVGGSTPDPGSSGGTSPASGGGTAGTVANSGGMLATGGGAPANGASASGGSPPVPTGGDAGAPPASGGEGGSSGGPDQAPSGCPRACGPTYAEFFEQSKLATLRVTLAGAVPEFSPEGHCPPFQWIPAQMTYESPDGVGNITLDNVGFRFRGSRVQPVQGFKLDLQVLDAPGPEGKRRFADLNRVNIASNEADPTHIMPCLGYQALRDFGIPAPRCNLIKVYLNGEYYGLLPNVEQINRGYLRRHFGDNTGSLYGASPSMSDCPDSGFRDSAARLVYGGDTFDAYTEQYQLTRATPAEAEQNLIPMLKCADATQTPDDAAYRTCITEWIEVDEWLRFIAGESVMPELHTFVGYYRNYYLYFRPDPSSPHQGRFVIWPWDLDSSMNKNRCYPTDCDVMTAVSSYFGPRNARAPFVVRLTSVFRAEYCRALRDFVSTVFHPGLIDGLAQVAEPAMANDPTHGTTEWQAAVSALREHVVTRAASAQASIDQHCE